MGAFGGKSKKPKPDKGAEPEAEAEVGGAWATKTTWADAEKPAETGVAPVTSPSSAKRAPPPGQEDEPDEECEVIDVGKAVSPTQLRPTDPTRAGTGGGPGDLGHGTAPPHVYSQANVQEAPVMDPPPEPQPVLPAEQQKAADRLARQRQELEKQRKGGSSDPFGEPSGERLVMPTFGGLEDLEEAILRDGLQNGLQEVKASAVVSPAGVSTQNGSNGQSKKFDESDEELMDTILNEITAVT